LFGLAGNPSKRNTSENVHEQVSLLVDSLDSPSWTPRPSKGANSKKDLVTGQIGVFVPYTMLTEQVSRRWTVWIPAVAAEAEQIERTRRET
jgi:hypothetical protein